MISESITITNNTKKDIKIVSRQDNTVLPSETEKVFIIPPQDWYTFFINCTESLTWEKE